jgi:ABC-type nitrate/sulfonate/bicarbonate transport system substrate-binding protein
VNDVALDHEMKLAILALASRVMDAIAERQQAEADLVGRYQDVVSTTTDTVKVGGESLAIERDAVALDERVETAAKFLRMVERSDGDYETTVTDALARFADLMEN